MCCIRSAACGVCTVDVATPFACRVVSYLLVSYSYGIHTDHGNTDRKDPAARVLTVTRVQYRARSRSSRTAETGDRRGPCAPTGVRIYIVQSPTVNSRMLDRMEIESVTLTHHVETTEDRKKTEPVCGDPALDAPPHAPAHVSHMPRRM